MIHGDFYPLPVRAGDDIDHPCNGICAIQGRCPIAQDFNAVNSRQRQTVQVDIGHFSAGDVLDAKRGQPPAIEQDQGSGRHAMQSPIGESAVQLAALRSVQTIEHLGQALHHLGHRQEAFSLNFLARDHLHGQGQGLLFANDRRAGDLHLFKLSVLQWLVLHRHRGILFADGRLWRGLRLCCAQTSQTTHHPKGEGGRRPKPFG